MFETTVVESKRRKIKSRLVATLPVSIALHFITIGGAVVANVWNVEFPRVAPSQYVLYRTAAPPPPPPPPPPPKARVTQVVQEVVRRPFDPREVMAPTVIPDTIPDLPPPEEMSSPDGIEGGVEGGIAGGEMGGVVGGVIGGVVLDEAPSGPSDPSGYYRAEFEVAKPFFTSQVFPEYPDGARLRGIEGTVVLDYIIGVDGRVREVRVLQDPHALLTKAAVAAIRKWRVKPTQVNGQPVEVIHKMTITFMLE